MIKKILSLLIILACSCTISIAAQDCKYYNCVAPYDMNTKFRSTMGAITGMNFFSEKIAQSILKKDISKTIKSDNLRVKLDSYTAKDIKNGRFKSLLISGDNVYTEGVYLSYLKMETLCDFNYIQDSDDGGVIFKEDFPMSFEFHMTADDINKTMDSERYQNVIKNVNKLGLGGVKISSTKVDIRTNHFYYIIYVSIPFLKSEKKIVVGADISAENGKIDYSKTYLTASSMKFDLSKVDSILNYLNPLDFSVKILNNKKAKVYVDTLKIENNIIKTNGFVVIPKS